MRDHVEAEKMQAVAVVVTHQSSQQLQSEGRQNDKRSTLGLESTGDSDLDNVLPKVLNTEVKII